MRLVKIGKVPGMIDISEIKIRELIREGIWKKGEHYYEHTALNHKLFDMEAIEKWIKGSDPVSKSMMDLAERMAG